MIRILTFDGKTISQAAAEKLQSVADFLKNNSGKIISKALLWTVRNHVQTIYPGSKHYNPNKVTEGISDGTSGSINIDIPGICRAYHDHVLTPKKSKKLTIPLNKESYGKPARSFSGLFYLKTKKNKEFLAKKKDSGNGIVMMYVLKDKVFQKQDKRLMPDDETLAENIINRLVVALANAILPLKSAINKSFRTTCCSYANLTIVEKTLAFMRNAHFCTMLYRKVLAFFCKTNFCMNFIRMVFAKTMLSLVFSFCQENEFRCRSRKIQSIFLQLCYRIAATWKYFSSMMAIPSLRGIGNCLIIVFYQRNVLTTIFFNKFFIYHDHIISFLK